MLLIEILGQAYVYKDLYRLDLLLARIGRPEVSRLAYLAVANAHQAHQLAESGQLPNAVYLLWQLSQEFTSVLHSMLLPHAEHWKEWIASVYNTQMHDTSNPYEGQAPNTPDERRALCLSIIARALATDNVEIMQEMRNPLSDQQLQELANRAAPLIKHYGTDIPDPIRCFQKSGGGPFGPFDGELTTCRD
jgi:hypothetical protein